MGHQGLDLLPSPGTVSFEAMPAEDALAPDLRLSERAVQWLATTYRIPDMLVPPAWRVAPNEHARAAIERRAARSGRTY